MDRRTCDGPSCMTVSMVRDPFPKGLHIFFQVSTNGHMRRTVVPATVHPAQAFWLSETLFFRVSHFF